MNRSNSVLGILEISKGGISGTVSVIRVIFVAAIKGNASGIICAHNHPSGNLNPGESDTWFTQKLKEDGSILDIALLDHLILSTEVTTIHLLIMFKYDTVWKYDAYIATSSFKQVTKRSTLLQKDIFLLTL